MSVQLSLEYITLMPSKYISNKIVQNTKKNKKGMRNKNAKWSWEREREQKVKKIKMDFLLLNCISGCHGKKSTMHTAQGACKFFSHKLLGSRKSVEKEISTATLCHHWYLKFLVFNYHKTWLESKLVCETCRPSYLAVHWSWRQCI